MRLLSGDNPKAKALVDYGRSVVDALGIINGPSHMEVMYCADGPCLVEVGSRCHGGEGSWIPIAQECIGYTQLDATLSCYLRPDRFDSIPPLPTLLKQGREVFIVSKQTGILMDIPGIDVLRGLKSFRRVEMMTQPGAHLPLTIDCFTRLVYVVIWHSIV